MLKSLYRWYKDKLRQHPELVIVSSCLGALIFVATLYNSTVTVKNALEEAYQALFSNPYLQAYERLSALKPPVSVDYVREDFGEPRIRRPLQRTTFSAYGLDGYSEWIYSEKGYFLKLFVNRQATVVAYSILLKDPEFRPPISLPGGVCRPDDECHLHLGEDTFQVMANRWTSASTYGHGELNYVEYAFVGPSDVNQGIILMATNSGAGIPNSDEIYDDVIELTVSNTGEPVRVDLGNLRSQLRPNVLFIADTRESSLVEYVVNETQASLIRRDILNLDTSHICRVASAGLKTLVGC